MPDSCGVNPGNSLLHFEPLGLRSCEASITCQDSSRSEMTGTCDNVYALQSPSAPEIFKSLRFLTSFCPAAPQWLPFQAIFQDFSEVNYLLCNPPNPKFITTAVIIVFCLSMIESERTELGCSYSSLSCGCSQLVAMAGAISKASQFTCPADDLVVG